MLSKTIRRFVLLGLTGAAAFAAATSSATAAGNVTCQGYDPNDVTDAHVFQGSAANVTVPPGASCVIANANVTGNVTIGSGALFGAINSTIGNDLVSNGAAVVDTGVYSTPGGKGPGPVKVGHNITLSGSSYNLDFCDTTVGNDFVANNLKNAFELQIGDTSMRDLDYTDGFYSCNGGTGFSLNPPVRINHDLRVTSSTLGLLDISNDSIGHDLVVQNDVATYPTQGYVPAGQGMWVAADTVGHDANCSGNSPALMSDGPDDTPNVVSHINTCKF